MVSSEHDLTAGKTNKYIFLESSQETGARAFFDNNSDDEIESSRAMSNYIQCPSDYQCMKLRRESESVCCPIPEPTIVPAFDEQRPQSSELHNIRTNFVYYNLFPQFFVLLRDSV